jgi:hypothetical protein
MEKSRIDKEKAALLAAVPLLSVHAVVAVRHLVDTIDLRVITMAIT